MKKLLLKTICLLTLVIATKGYASSQEKNNSSDSFLKNKISVNLGVIPFQEMGTDEIKLSFHGMYGINNWLDAGLFTELSTDLVTFNSGVAVKAHLLPVIINPSFYRFDIYANLQLGLGSIDFNSWGIATGIYLGGGLGAGFNISKNIGVFYEINYSNMYYFIHKAGLKLTSSQKKKFSPTDSYQKGNTTLSIGVSVNHEGGFEQPMMNFNILKGFNDWFDAGLFADLGYYKDYLLDIEFHPFVICYGAAARVHFLPIIVEQTNYKFDLYANFQFGGMSYIHKKIQVNESMYVKRATTIYTETSLGAAYHFNEKIGIFYEFELGNSHGIGHQIGLSFSL